MMTDIAIPPEVVEAGARAISGAPFATDKSRKKARTCFQAMMKAWPGMEVKLYWRAPDEIVLPLMEEKSNDNS